MSASAAGAKPAVEPERGSESATLAQSKGRDFGLRNQKIATRIAVDFGALFSIALITRPMRQPLGGIQGQVRN